MVVYHSKMFQRIINFLNQPYPDRDTFRSICIGSIVSGIIVAIILALFIPFGLHEVNRDTYSMAFYFGCITSLTAFLFESIQRYLLNIRRDQANWTFWKWLVSTIILVLCIALANYKFVEYNFGDMGYISNFGTMLRNTVVVGIFPIVAFGSFNLIKNLKANQHIAATIVQRKTIEDSNQIVSLPIKNSSKIFKIDVANIIYLEAMQNYVSICYLDEDKKCLKELHRNTMQGLSDVLVDYQIKRCHRSFLVNPAKISKVSGNAQGLKLHFEETNDIVPVSRKYISDFR